MQATIKDLGCDSGVGNCTRALNKSGDVAARRMSSGRSHPLSVVLKLERARRERVNLAPFLSWSGRPGGRRIGPLVKTRRSDRDQSETCDLFFLRPMISNFRDAHLAQAELAGGPELLLRHLYQRSSHTSSIRLPL